tara:strand:+ start:225 stop:482 length:258 start_codon:yes stop_codon:yes gene_type:complete
MANLNEAYNTLVDEQQKIIEKLKKEQKNYKRALEINSELYDTSEKVIVALETEIIEKLKELIKSVKLAQQPFEDLIKECVSEDDH